MSLGLYSWGRGGGGGVNAYLLNEINEERGRSPYKFALDKLSIYIYIYM
jgi:hypothetical protein